MLGNILENYGQIFNSEDLMLVHFKLKKGDEINEHDHIGQEVFFNVIEGSVEVYLNKEETHICTPKKVLNFKGENKISAKAIQDSDVFVYLVNRRR